MGSVDPDAVLGDELHAARLEAGLTLEAAAERAGLSPTRLAGVEGGDGLLVVADLVPLLRACGTSLARFGARYEAALHRAEGGRDEGPG